MATIHVVSDDDQTTAIIEDSLDDDGECRYYYRCQRCNEHGTDRGHFEDTIEAASIHVDRCLQS